MFDCCGEKREKWHEGIKKNKQKKTAVSFLRKCKQHFKVGKVASKCEKQKTKVTIKQVWQQSRKKKDNVGKSSLSYFSFKWRLRGFMIAHKS